MNKNDGQNVKIRLQAYSLTTSCMANWANKLTAEQLEDNLFDFSL